jgi:hypothetical protein
VPILRRSTPEGAAWVRPRYRPEDYTAPAEVVRTFERWRGDAQPGSVILADRESPFSNYVEVAREPERGSTRVTLLEASREFGLEVELAERGFGRIEALPPERAYELARDRDRLRSVPVVVEP